MTRDEISDLVPGIRYGDDDDGEDTHAVITQGSQHTQAQGDVCYGDAGGSVWKLWSFRDLNNE